MLISELVCKHHALRAYQKKALPKRFHFSNNPRIENIVLDIDPGYTVTLSDDIENQGYGYYKKNKQVSDMQLHLSLATLHYSLFSLYLFRFSISRVFDFVS